jgi:hypothetical protein
MKVEKKIIKNKFLGVYINKCSFYNSYKFMKVENKIIKNKFWGVYINKCSFLEKRAGFRVFPSFSK